MRASFSYKRTVASLPPSTSRLVSRFRGNMCKGSDRRNGHSDSYFFCFRGRFGSGSCEGAEALGRIFSEDEAGFGRRSRVMGLSVKQVVNRMQLQGYRRSDSGW